MRMQVTALLLVCLGAWIHTAESGQAEEFDTRPTYPEDLDGSGDDLEISGSGSGDEGTNAPNFSVTSAPATNESERVTENKDSPVEVAGETVTTTATMTSDAPPTEAAATTQAPVNPDVPIDAAATAQAPVSPDVPVDSAATTQEPVNPDVPVDVAAATTQAPISPDPADTTHAPVNPAAAATKVPTEIPATATAPEQSATPGAPWELPEDPVREATSASPVTAEAEDTPPHIMGTSVPEATESSPVETLLTTQSSPTTAVPPVGVDTGVEISTGTPVLPEEEEEEEEEEETATPTEKTDLFPASTPGLETELDSALDEMASGDGTIAASTDSPLATESVGRGGPLIPVDDEVIIPKNRGNVENALPDDSDMTFEDTGKTEGAFSENQSLLERKEVLGGVIAGGVVGLAFAIMLVALMVYRMKKKDEGSYSLDEHKHPNGGYQKARREEEFLA